MSENQTNNRFGKGFQFGLILFLVFQIVTLIDFVSMVTAEFGTSSFVHRFWDFGFPLSMFAGMFAAFSGDGNFLGFILNIIFAIIFSLSLGLIFIYVSSLRILVKSKFFIIGFSAGIILFVALNFISYIQNEDGSCFDCMMFFGFPFKFVGHGGFVTHTEISWYALSKNFIICGLFSFYLGFFADLMQRKLFEKSLK